MERQDSRKTEISALTSKDGTYNVTKILFNNAVFHTSLLAYHIIHCQHLECFLLARHARSGMIRTPVCPSVWCNVDTPLHGGRYARLRRELLHKLLTMSFCVLFFCTFNASE